MSHAIRAYETLLQNPKMVLCVLLSILIFFGYQTRDFELDASADSLLLEGDADLELVRSIQERYPSNELLIVTYTPKDDLFSSASLEHLRSLRGELEKVNGVDSIFSILDAPLFNSSDTDIQKMINNLPSIEMTGVDRSRAKKELVNSPIYRDLIVSGDGSTAALLLSLSESEKFNQLIKSRDNLRMRKRNSGLTNQEVESLEIITSEYNQINKERNSKRHHNILQIREIIESYRKYGTLHLGGLPMITDDMVTFVRNDLIVFGGGVLIFLIIILTVIFRKIRWIILPLLSCFYSGLIMIGALGLVGWKVTVISSNFLALMLIITISMNIHLIVRYLQLHRDNPDDTQLVLVQSTISKMIRPCFYTVLTTIIGFGSLVISDIKPVIDFGWMMSAGLIVTFITSFVLFPILLMLLGKSEPRLAVKEVQFPVPSYLARVTHFHGNKIMLVTLILTLVSIAGISMLRVENSFINYFSKNTEIHRGLKLIDEKLGGTTPVEILIKLNRDGEELTEEDLKEMSPDEIKEEREFLSQLRTRPELWFNPTKVELIKKAHDYLEGLPEIGKVLSFASSVRVAEVLANKKLDGLDLSILYSKLPSNVKNMIIEPFISIKNNEIRLVARVLDSSPDLRRKELLEKLQVNLSKESGFKQLAQFKPMIKDVQISGLLVLYNNMLQSLFSSQIKTIGVVLFGIALMFLILFRSITLSIIGILPNILGAGVVLGLMGLLKIPMDMMTITIAAITIGIAVDNGIHYIYRFREEYALSNDYIKTLYICHSSIGKAVFYTTLTVVFGFSILVMSNFIPTIIFGILTGAAMLIALLAALTLLPKMILLWKPFG